MVIELASSRLFHDGALVLFKKAGRVEGQIELLFDLALRFVIDLILLLLKALLALLFKHALVK